MKRNTIIILFSGFLFYGCDAILEVEDLSDDNISIIAPTNDSVLTDSVINFNWETVDEAVNYHFQIALPSFLNANQILIDSLVNINKISIELQPNNYEWRLRAENSNYKTEYLTNSFKVEE